MEEPNKAKSNPADDEAEQVLDLTDDMALSEQAEVQIIDLTDDIDDNSAPQDSQKPEEPIHIEPEMASAAPAPGSPVEEINQESVEKEVDNAFDLVDEPAFSPASTESLFDDLSDVPEQVDMATDSNVSSLDLEDDIFEEMPSETPNAEVDELSLAAAEIESAMSGYSDDDDEVIDLTDIAAPQAAASAGIQAEPGDDDDDDVIELLDIVDPNELLAAPLADPENDDILELTDIVRPTEPVQPAAAPEPLESSRQTPAAYAESTPEITPEVADTEDLALRDTDETEKAVSPAIESEKSDDPIDETASDQIAAALTPEMDLSADETALQLDDERMDTDADTTDAPIAIGALEIDENKEQDDNGLIRLTDVLPRSKVEAEKLPVEQIKMGAEEDLAQEPISLEAEEAAKALGLHLEQEARDNGQKSLTEQEIEAAVEKIIQDRYADTIEQLIANAVEKAVTREMETIRQAMMDGEDPLAS